MAHGTMVELDEKMQEIVDLAITDGDGKTAQEIVRLALEAWWSNVLLSGYGSAELKSIGDGIVHDTRPGRPAEEVFAELDEYCARLEQERRTVDAA